MGVLAGEPSCFGLYIMPLIFGNSYFTEAGCVATIEGRTKRCTACSAQRQAVLFNANYISIDV